jgi:hypothetical protein
LAETELERAVRGNGSQIVFNRGLRAAKLAGERIQQGPIEADIESA